MWHMTNYARFDNGYSIQMQNVSLLPSTINSLSITGATDLHNINATELSQQQKSSLMLNIVATFSHCPDMPIMRP